MAYPLIWNKTLKVALDDLTFQRLVKMAEEQLRDPEQQVSWMIREVLDDPALTEWVRSKEKAGNRG